MEETNDMHKPLMATHHSHTGGAGFWLSMVCLVHCLAMPFLVVAAPSFSSYVPAGEYLELGFIGLAFMLVAFQLYPAARRHHRKFWVPALATISLGLVLISHTVISEFWHMPLSIAGSLGMAFCFLQNHRLVHHRS